MHDAVRPEAKRPLIGWLVLLVATGVAAVSARPFAGAWNDGSRLATVESLIDHHTWRIDDSLFVGPAPYPPGDPFLRFGTLDKLLIEGHYYSDKSPAPALLLASAYWLEQRLTGRTAQSDPDWFCYTLTLFSSGFAYVVAVTCIYQLGGVLRLPLATRLLLTASFGLSTVAVVYARHVNNHLLLLGVAAALTLQLARLGAEGRASRWSLLGIGSLTGLGYSIDLGVGPVLLLCTLLLLVFRCRRTAPVACFVLGALPWLALHHAVNYAIGGTFKPANAVVEYFNWPGCPFNAGNMTGTLKHSPGHFLLYAAALLFGKHGFLLHNLPLLLALPGGALLLRRRVAELPELIHAFCWSGGAWLAYALTSTNYSGLCCSIRWFVPLLAPGFYVLGVLLRHVPRHRSELLALSIWGAVLMALAWQSGPWNQRMVPLYWPLGAAGLTTWALVSWRLSRREPTAGAVRESRRNAA